MEIFWLCGKKRKNYLWNSNLFRLLSAGVKKKLLKNHSHRCMWNFFCVWFVSSFESAQLYFFLHIFYKYFLQMSKNVSVSACVFCKKQLSEYKKVFCEQFAEQKKTFECLGNEKIFCSNSWNLRKAANAVEVKQFLKTATADIFASCIERILIATREEKIYFLFLHRTMHTHKTMLKNLYSSKPNS